MEQGQGNLDRTDHLNHIAQAHRVGEPAHGLLHVAAALGIPGLFLMGIGQQGQFVFS